MPDARRLAAVVLLFSLVGIGFWTNPAFAHHRPGHEGGPPTATPTHPTPPPHPTPNATYPPPTEEPCLIDVIVQVPGDGTIIVKVCAEALTTGTLTIFSEPRVLGEFKTDRNGVFEGTFALPRDLEPGRHTVVASGDGLGEGGGELRKSVELTGASMGRRSASTRAGTPMLALWIFVLVLFGWLIRGLSRRPSHAVPVGRTPTRAGGARLTRSASLEPGVPFLDTSGFEDRLLRREVATNQTGTTEADVGMIGRS